MKRLSDFEVHYDKGGYAAFPSLQVTPDGMLYVVFRYAPTRRSKTHIDTRSVAILKKSTDAGETWEKVSELQAPPYSGIQDPSLAIIHDTLNDTLYVNFFTWSAYELEHTKKAKKVRTRGMFIRCSKDWGRTWGGDIRAPRLSNLQVLCSEPIIRVGDELLVAGYANMGGGGDACVLMRSNWVGHTEWSEPQKIAHDVSGNKDYQEPALLNCGDGHLLCMARVSNEGLYQIHSWDNGETWEPPKQTPIRGFPANLLRWVDGRVLCTYGYRKPPYGIRACLSRNEGLTWEIEDEMMIRTDGRKWDLGYPSTVQLRDGNLLTAYYFHTKGDRTRRIEATKWKL